MIELIDAIIVFFDSLDVKIQVAAISGLITFVIFIIKPIYENWSLGYKLKKEFNFDQKKQLKEEIASNKMFLLNTIEDFNSRLRNFDENIDKGWHNKDEIDYYLKSFVFRFLKLIHYIIKTEREALTIDSTIADIKDITFLKYVKSLKEVFCDAKLLQDLNYDVYSDSHHFYKDDLIKYSKLVLDDNNEVVDFDRFELKLIQDQDKFDKVLSLFKNIRNDNSAPVLNILRVYHLISIHFMNQFGHDYQIVSKKKLSALMKDYKSKIMVPKGIVFFIEKNKLEKELKPIVKLFK